MNKRFVCEDFRYIISLYLSVNNNILYYCVFLVLNFYCLIDI